ncbi:MAG: hypothetical protein ACFCU8_05975 [Thermosynechococcaceae cyanobacterium]
MSERLDRIEALQEQTQIQIDVLVEEVTLMQQVDSLAKSVHSHCDDTQRHQ